MHAARLPLLIALACALALCACANYPHETRGVRTGVLRCNALPDSRANVLITSSVEVECVFQTDDREDRYTGRTGVQLGIDASYLTREQFWFTVFSAVSDPKPGFLEGRYVGAKAGATVGLGVGVGTLIGGGDGNTTLEPFTLEVTSGIGVAVGISFLTLDHAPQS